MRNQLLLQLSAMSVFLLGAPRVMRELLPPPGTADDLPFTNVPELIVSLVLPFMPFLAVITLVVLMLVFVFGESSGGSHEPLTDDARGVRDLHGLRSVLRRVREWLAQQQFPAVTEPLATSIGTLCLELDRQLEGRDRARVATAMTALHKLLTVELATLVLRYQRVPRAQRLLPYLNASANDLLVNGLRAVDDQLRAVHEDLAKSDLHDLHVQTRYLELKSENESRTFAPAAPTNVGIDPGVANTTTALKTSAAAASASSIPLSTAPAQRREEREDTGLTLLQTVGVAAVTTAMMETLLDDDDDRRDGEEPYAGGGGAFGGAGASGDWLDDSNEVDASESEGDSAEFNESA